MTNVGERLEEVAASIVSVAFHADVYLGGEILMLMTQKDLVDIVKLVMQSNIALGEEYVDLTPIVKMKETKTQIKYETTQQIKKTLCHARHGSAAGGSAAGGYDKWGFGGTYVNGYSRGYANGSTAAMMQVRYCKQPKIQDGPSEW